MTKFNVGQLLKDKNAIFNYIKDSYNRPIGIVVGMKGKDRDNPIIGWALFSEFDDGSYVSDRQNYLANVALNDVYTSIDRYAKLCGNPSTRDYIKRVKELITTPTMFVSPNKEIKYKTVEMALLRANTNRDTYFVCSNPIYNQWGSNLIAPEREVAKENEIVTVYGNASDFGLSDKVAIPSIRQACRSMEFRCWRYFR